MQYTIKINNRTLSNTRNCMSPFMELIHYANGLIIDKSPAKYEGYCLSADDLTSDELYKFVQLFMKYDRDNRRISPKIIREYLPRITEMLDEQCTELFHESMIDAGMQLQRHADNGEIYWTQRGGF